MATIWSEQAWKESEKVYHAILELPFLRELADGNLPIEKFKFYIGQDALYLNDYTRRLAHIASRLKNPEMIETFLNFASNGVAVEKSLHESFITEIPESKSPTCLFYTSLLGSTATENVAVECAVILPCFWIYREVGSEIMKRAKMDGNPYAQWIATYADENFSKSTDICISICDRLASNSTIEVRQRMTEVFHDAARLEWAFWISAYNLETWDF